MRVANRSASNERASDVGVDAMGGRRPAPETTESGPKPSEYHRDSFESTPRERAMRLAQSRLRELEGRPLREERCAAHNDPRLSLARLPMRSLTQGPNPVCLSASAMIAAINSVNALPDGERSAELAFRLEGTFARTGQRAPDAVTQICARLRRGEPLRPTDLATIANGLDVVFCPRNRADSSVGDRTPATQFSNELMMVNRLFSCDRAHPMDLRAVPRTASLAQLAPSLTEALHNGEFALVSGNCGGVPHDISITRNELGFCWHDTREAGDGQRRTFTAPTIGALLEAVQTEVQNRRYDFELSPMPEGTSPADRQFAARVYSHRNTDGTPAPRPSGGVR